MIRLYRFVFFHCQFIISAVKWYCSIDLHKKRMNKIIAPQKSCLGFPLRDDCAHYFFVG